MKLWKKKRNAKTKRRKWSAIGEALQKGCTLIATKDGDKHVCVDVRIPSGKRQFIQYASTFNEALEATEYYYQHQNPY